MSYVQLTSETISKCSILQPSLNNKDRKKRKLFLLSVDAILFKLQVRMFSKELSILYLNSSSIVQLRNKRIACFTSYLKTMSSK